MNLKSKYGYRYYSMRIHELIWLHYDRRTGFAELWQYSDPKRFKPGSGEEDIAKITIPRPIKTDSDLEQLLHIITY